MAGALAFQLRTLSAVMCLAPAARACCDFAVRPDWICPVLPVVPSLIAPFRISFIIHVLGALRGIADRT